MQLKIDENGNVVLQDNKPVYVYQDGKEIPFDAAQAFGKIRELNDENKSHRERAEAAEAKLSLFGDLDPDKAKKAMETVLSLDQKKLIDAGEVDKVKSEISQAYEAKLSAKDKEITDRDTKIYGLMVTSRFSSSKFIKDTISIPPDMVEAKFGQNFKLEDGQVVAYLDGNKLYSRKNPGNLPDFDEALELMIEAYPAKESILKGTGQSGTGTPPANTGNAGQGAKGIKDMTPAEKAAYIGKHGLEKFQETIYQGVK